MKVMEVILVRQVILEMQETQIMQIMQENLHICESTSEFTFVWTKYAKTTKNLKNLISQAETKVWLTPFLVLFIKCISFTQLQVHCSVCQKVCKSELMNTNEHYRSCNRPKALSPLTWVSVSGKISWGKNVFFWPLPELPHYLWYWSQPLQPAVLYLFKSVYFLV